MSVFSDSNMVYKHKKYSVHSSSTSDCDSHPVVAQKPNLLLERIIRLQSHDKRPKNTEGDIYLVVCFLFGPFLHIFRILLSVPNYTQVCDASTQTDPQQMNLQLAIHGGNRIVFKVLP